MWRSPGSCLFDKTRQYYHLNTHDPYSNPTTLAINLTLFVPWYFLSTSERKLGDARAHRHTDTQTLQTLTNRWDVVSESTTSLLAACRSYALVSLPRRLLLTAAKREKSQHKPHKHTNTHRRAAAPTTQIQAPSAAAVLAERALGNEPSVTPRSIGRAGRADSSWVWLALPRSVAAPQRMKASTTCRGREGTGGSERVEDAVLLFHAFRHTKQDTSVRGPRCCYLVLG